MEGRTNPTDVSLAAAMRVIAGSLKGAAIRTPKGRSVRPTYDRVRESLFSMLEPELTDSAILDLFAGSGSLGIESLSRGARAATFVEKDPATLSVLRENIRGLGLEDRSSVLKGDAVRLLDGPLPGAPFDVVFVDPPYATDLAEESLLLLGAGGLLDASAVVVVEHDSDRTLPAVSGGLLRYREKRYGGTSLDLYRSGAGRHERREDT